MGIKVRDFLNPLRYAELQTLCRKRGLVVSGNRSKLLERLARSYKGDFQSLILHLRKQDLIKIGYSLSGQFELPLGWRDLLIKEMQRVFTTAVTARVEPWERAEIDEQIQFFSSGYVGEIEGVQRLTAETLHKTALQAMRTTVISAYYGKRLLKKLLSGCRGEVRVILNGLGGQRLNAQLEDLENLQKEIQYRSPKTEIRLSFSDGIFHTKLYLFESKQGTVGWIGSANATSAGLEGHNEEVLVRVSPVPAAMLAYAEKTWVKAQPLDDCVQDVNSLIAFYRTGTLYYKPYTQLEKSFNPFRDWIKGLSDEDRDKIPGMTLPNAERGGIPPFNIYTVFKKHVPEDRMSVQTQVSRRRSGNGGTSETQLRIRNYAVETCYGYWVHETFVADLNHKIEQAAQGIESELEDFKEWLSDREDTITAEYKNYLSAAKKELDNAQVNYVDESPFEKWEIVKDEISKLKIKLSDKSKIQRLCHGFLPGEVPELWEDTTARIAFERSFFESLATASSKSRRPKAASMILDVVGIKHAESAKNIQRKLKKWLENGRYPKYFP